MQRAGDVRVPGWTVRHRCRRYCFRCDMGRLLAHATRNVAGDGVKQMELVVRPRFEGS